MLKAMSSRKAAFNLWQTLAVGSIALWVLVAVDGPLASFITGQEPEKRLEVEYVKFKDGFFHQKVDPVETDAIQATWTASIWLGSYEICGGSGRSTYYRGDASAKFVAADWTGDDCSGLIVGAVYEARVSWTWIDEEGLEKTEARKFEFIHEQAETGS